MAKPKTQLPLQSCRIMITRPRQLADRLSELCAAQGATVIRFPCMEIVNTADNEDNVNKIKHIDQYCLLIFISRNAVYYATRLFQKIGLERINIPVAAVGIKTAQALAAAGLPNVIHPRTAPSGEALAATQFIKDLKQGSVLILRGHGGARYLGEQLTRQGLKVDYAEVYRRQRPKTRLQWDTQHQPPHLITVASGETLANLHAMTAQCSLATLLARQLVLGSTSMKALHDRLGFARTPIIADSPIDDDMFEAILKHYKF